MVRYIKELRFCRIDKTQLFYTVKALPEFINSPADKLLMINNTFKNCQMHSYGYAFLFKSKNAMVRSAYCLAFWCVLDEMYI